MSMVACGREARPHATKWVAHQDTMVRAADGVNVRRQRLRAESSVAGEAGPYNGGHTGPMTGKHTGLMTAGPIGVLATVV